MAIRLNKFVLSVLVFASASSAMTENTWTLSPDGFGPIKIGTPLAQISKLAKSSLTQSRPQSHEDVSCFLTSVKDSKYKDVSFMISHGRVARIDIANKQYPSSKGIYIGDSEAKVKSKYGSSLKIQPHHYNSNGHYLTASPNHKRAIRFETDGKSVTLMYAGKFPEVTFVEDCL